MKTSTLIKKATAIVNRYNNINAACRAELEQLGFHYEELGTGESAYTCSGKIEVMDIKSRYYLNGKYLVVGMSNRGYRKGCIYRGMVIEL